MWDYIYYCGFLYDKKKKMQIDLNDLENYVLQKLEAGDTSWLPAS